MRKSAVLGPGCLARRLVLAVSPSAQSPASSGYHMPPKVIADIMDAEPLPTVSVSPDRTVLLLAHRRAMPTLAEVAAPFLGLAGARVNPRTNGPRVLGGTTALTLRDVATGTERKLTLPATGSFVADVLARRQAHRASRTPPTARIRLLVADVATAQVRVAARRRHQRPRRRLHLERRLHRLSVPAHRRRPWTGAG